MTVQKNIAASLGVCELPEAVEGQIATNEDRFLVKLSDSPLMVLSFSVRDTSSGNLRNTLQFKFKDKNGRDKTGTVPVWLNQLDSSSMTLVPVGQLQGVSNRHGLMTRCETAFQTWRADRVEQDISPGQEGSLAPSDYSNEDIPLS